MIAYQLLNKHFYICIACILLFSSCETKLTFPENPCALPQCTYEQTIGLALVLGGGGAKGMAHVGVIEEFEKANIPIDLIVGCSAGSIIGAIYADYPDAAHLKKTVMPLCKWDILDINVFCCRYGFVQGRSLRRFLRCRLSCKYFEELQIP